MSDTEINEKYEACVKSKKENDEAMHSLALYLILDAETGDLDKLRDALHAETFKKLEIAVATKKKAEADFEEWYHANGEKVMG